MERPAEKHAFKINIETTPVKSMYPSDNAAAPIGAAWRQAARVTPLLRYPVPRLWRDEGKPQQACELLAPVYGWFTEGSDTRDLKEAKACLRSWADTNDVLAITAFLRKALSNDRRTRR
jgi:hypothetical protein